MTELPDTTDIAIDPPDDEDLNAAVPVPLPDPDDVLASADDDTTPADEHESDEEDNG